MANGRRIPRGLLLALVLLTLSLFARAETITVATYNVENYLETDRMVDGTFREKYPKTEEAKSALRIVIKELDADVLALQEMGAQPYLDELKRDLAKEGVNYAYVALLEAADSDRHIAVLSKRPFTSVVKHTDLHFNYFGRQEPVKRGLLEVRFATDSGELTLFVVHLKSRFTDRKDDPLSAQRRGGEATEIRDRVLKTFPVPLQSRYLLVGDCNDLPGSRPLRALCQKGQLTIAEKVPARDSRGHTWTHHFRKEDTYSRVDYVLVSPGLKLKVQDGVGRVWDSPATEAASDHRPVRIVLRLGDSPSE